MTLIAMTPTINGITSQLLCGSPERKKAGKCHIPQINPTINEAQKGAYLRCNIGCNRSRQPNSSMGPNIAINPIAASPALMFSNGHSVQFGSPFSHAPTKKIRGMTTKISKPQFSPQRHTLNRVR